MGLKKVLIKWNDAVSHSDTKTISDATKLKPYRRETIGYLIVKNKKCVVVSATFDEKDSQVDTITVIPQDWVIKITELK
jgi:phosphoserine phosphatase